MFLSTFEIFKLGIGPSSSHTMGPMTAAGRFLAELRGIAASGRVPARLSVSLHGSLAFTGHANGLVFRSFDAQGEGLLSRTYYSIGGGFVVTDEELSAKATAVPAVDCPFPFRSAAEMLAMGKAHGIGIAAMKRANEDAAGGPGLDSRIDRVIAAMNACIDRGLEKEGILPGGLKVRRRARAIQLQLLAERGRNDAQPHVVNDWLSVYAMAVNEENAAGGRVVTSPTNGAAGVVPAVLRYYRDHCHGATEKGARDFLLVAAAIGGLIKHNASISGAEVGCQGEVGSASAMAAAGLCAALGGSNEQWRTRPKSRSNITSG